MSKKKYTVGIPELSGNEKKYINDALDTNWISSAGKYVNQFEENFSKYLGINHTITVSNGTTALHLALVALGISKDDEVIISNHNGAYGPFAIEYVGAKPVFIESKSRTWNIDPSLIEEKITKNTKAIMIVHIYGLTVDVDPVLALAKKHDLKVIEDAAEMFGQNYKDKKCGSFGDISTFSFYPNKHITTGEGGMVLTNDKTLDDRSKSLRNLCFTKDRFIHEEIGYNYRMTNMQAAIGVAQLEQIEDMVIKKRWIGETYNKLLKDIDSINLPIIETDYCKNIYWVYALILKDDFKKTPQEVMHELKKLSIGTRPFFYPMHKQPIFNKMGFFKEDDLPISEKLYERGFYIPSGLALTESQIKKVSDAMHEVLL